MKKGLFTSCIMAIAIISFMVVPAFAGGWNFGTLDIETKAGAAAIDSDFKTIPNGAAFGVSGATGKAKADANGFVLNGTVEGEVDALGGGLTVTDSYRLHNPVSGVDASIGVGSSSTSQANTAASVKIKVDPDRHGFGVVDADISGFAAQGTLNASGLKESPIYANGTTGFTGGISAQGSVGGFEGDAWAMSGPDYRGWCRPVDSKAGAGMGAEITMVGGSYSESYRFFDKDGNITTTGMGTNVGAFTTVTSHGYDYDWDRGLACSDADVNGGFKVVGGAASITKQNAPGTGVAVAKALGVYSGSGRLGSTYNGSAVGYTHTTVATVDGMKGSIVSSGAGMKVTSTHVVPVVD